MYQRHNTIFGHWSWTMWTIQCWNGVPLHLTNLSLKWFTYWLVSLETYSTLYCTQVLYTLHSTLYCTSHIVHRHCSHSSVQVSCESWEDNCTQCKVTSDFCVETGNINRKTKQCCGLSQGIYPVQVWPENLMVFIIIVMQWIMLLNMFCWVKHFFLFSEVIALNKIEHSNLT